MQFELKRLPDYSDEALIKEILRVAGLIHNTTISRTEFRKHSRVHPSTIEKRFGTWEKAMGVAGLSDRFDSSNKAISKEEIIVELQKISSQLGVKSFSREQFNANALFKDSVIRRVFGTWRKAMEAAGLSANRLGQRYTDEECFENLFQVWTHYGRPPQHREMSLPPSFVGPKAYVLRWGTWNKALFAFVQRVNEDLTPEHLPGPETSQQDDTEKRQEPRNSERDHRDIKLGLRYTVLVRDRFRCVLCGASPATSLDCRLHVDHITPFSRGGKTEIMNLRTLCSSCNLGKGARTEENAEQLREPDAVI